MIGSKLKVVWSDDAWQQLKAAYNYIKKDSLQNAKNVRSDITEMTRSLSENPRRYAPDKNKLDNDESYRTFEKHKYRIAYRILEKESRILRVRHTSMEPKNY